MLASNPAPAVMVPLSALNFGSFLAEFSPICDKEDQGKEYEMANQNVDENGSGGSTGEVGRRHEAGKEGSVPRSAVTGASSSVDQEESHTTSGYVACGCCGSTIDMASRHLELLLLFLFVFITLLIICLSPNESQWIFAALSGAIGAYFRLGLSSMNRMREGFPLGTFAANVLGSWIEASVLVLAKLGVDYNEQLSQQFLFGMAIGYDSQSPQISAPNIVHWTWRCYRLREPITISPIFPPARAKHDLPNCHTP